MKKWTKKIWMSAVAVVIAIMSVSAIPASADVSRVVYFTIQNNSVCSGSGYATNFEFNINNISNSSSAVTVHLYDNNGNELTTAGVTSNGLGSTITPGTSFVIAGKETKQYVVGYGGAGASCSDRPAFGKIVIEDDQGLFLANGETLSYRTADRTLVTNASIAVNNGQPF